jgi:LysR family glycine cleavage system transcriptional activator
VFKKARLLRDEFHHWEAYLQGCGVDPRQVRYGALYGDSAQLLEAAEQGQGVALARGLLAQDALAQGSLARIGDVQMPGLGAYYLVSPQPPVQLGPAVAAFAQWLRHAMRAAAQSQLGSSEQQHQRKVSDGGLCVTGSA